MSNIEGEWYVAYHGVARHQESSKVEEITKKYVKMVLSFQQEEKQLMIKIKDILAKNVVLGFIVLQILNMQNFFQEKSNLIMKYINLF